MYKWNLTGSLGSVLTPSAALLRDLHAVVATLALLLVCMGYTIAPDALSSAKIRQVSSA